MARSRASRNNADGRHEYDRGWFDGKHVATGARVPRATTSAGAMGISRMLRAKILMGAMAMSEDGSTLLLQPWVV